MALDARHTVIAVLVGLKDKIRERDVDQIMGILCDDPECTDCGILCCPNGDFLHFHHDGCPACDVPPESESDA